MITTSKSLYPKEVITKTSPSLALNLNFPSKSVEAPIAVFLIITEAEITDSPVSESVIIPVISFACP